MAKRIPTEAKIRIEQRLKSFGLRACHVETWSGTKWILASFCVVGTGSRRTVRVPVAGGLVEDSQIEAALRNVVGVGAAVAYGAGP